MFSLPPYIRVILCGGTPCFALMSGHVPWIQLLAGCPVSEPEVFPRLPLFQEISPVRYETGSLFSASLHVWCF